MVKRNKKQVSQTEQKEPERVEAENIESDSAAVVSVKVEQTPEEKKKAYIQSLTRTAVASLMGVLAGIACYLILGAAVPAEGETAPLLYAWFIILPLVLIFTYYIQRRLLLPVLRMDMKSLTWKSWFGIMFLVFVYCLITWTFLLNKNIF